MTDAQQGAIDKRAGRLIVSVFHSRGRGKMVMSKQGDQGAEGLYDGCGMHARQTWVLWIPRRQKFLFVVSGVGRDWTVEDESYRTV